MVFFFFIPIVCFSPLFRPIVIHLFLAFSCVFKPPALPELVLKERVGSISAPQSLACKKNRHRETAALTNALTPSLSLLHLPCAIMDAVELSLRALNY